MQLAHCVSTTEVSYPRTRGARKTQCDQILVNTLSRVTPWIGQPQGLVETEHQVHVLDRLTRAALEQVVERAVAVGTGLSSKGSARPPHRTRRAGLPHRAPTSGLGAETLVRPRMLFAGRR